MSSFLGLRLLARGIDCLIVLLVYRLLSLTGDLPYTLLTALILYPLCTALFGQSLGKYLCQLTVLPDSKFRLITRELLLWVLAPLVLLSILGQRPLHDRLTGCYVKHG